MKAALRRLLIRAVPKQQPLGETGKQLLAPGGGPAGVAALSMNCIMAQVAP